MDAITIAIIIIASMLLIIGVYYFVKKMSVKEGKKAKDPFSSGEKDLKIKADYLNKDEFYFYNFVREHLDKKYYILPKVGVDNILEPQNGNLRQYNAIKQKYIDFIVFDVSTQKALFAIDLVEHALSVKGGNPYFDKDVKSALDTVGLPICVKYVEKYYIWDVLSDEFKKYLGEEDKDKKDDEKKEEKEPLIS